MGGNDVAIESMREPAASDLSPLFESADSAAVGAKRRMELLTALRLGFVVLAAVGGATDLASGGRNWSGVLAAASFAIALLLEVELQRSGARRIWLHGRLLAEMARTLAWRYAVGGPPFPVGDAEADRRFLEHLERVAESVASLELEIHPSTGPSITHWMSQVRAMNWSRRADYYLNARVYAQQRFIDSRARAAKRAAGRWEVAMLVLDAVGIGGGVLKAADVLHVDTLGITAALIGAIGAWLETSQHNAVANSYSWASQQLSLAASRLELARSELGWRTVVDACEQAMDAETMSWGGVHGVESAPALQGVEVGEFHGP